MLHFGLEQSGSVDRVAVVWPNGTERTIRNVSGNQRIVVTPDGLSTETASEKNGR